MTEYIVEMSKDDYAQLSLLIDLKNFAKEYSIELKKEINKYKNDIKKSEKELQDKHVSITFLSDSDKALLMNELREIKVNRKKGMVTIDD